MSETTLFHPVARTPWLTSRLPQAWLQAGLGELKRTYRSRGEVLTTVVKSH